MSFYPDLKSIHQWCAYSLLTWKDCCCGADSKITDPFLVSDDGSWILFLGLQVIKSAEEDSLQRHFPEGETDRFNAKRFIGQCFRVCKPKIEDTSHILDIGNPIHVRRGEEKRIIEDDSMPAISPGYGFIIPEIRAWRKAHGRHDPLACLRTGGVPKINSGVQIESIEYKSKDSGCFIPLYSPADLDVAIMQVSKNTIAFTGSLRAYLKMEIWKVSFEASSSIDIMSYGIQDAKGKGALLIGKLRLSFSSLIFSAIKTVT